MKLFEEKIESIKNDMVTQNEVYDKRMHFYNQGLGGWLNSALEKDKTIIALSAAELGAIISYFSSSKTLASIEYHLLVFSALFLMVAIFSSLVSFDMNKKYLMDSICERDVKDIGWIDRVSHYAFIFGTILTIINFAIIISAKVH